MASHLTAVPNPSMAILDIPASIIESQEQPDNTARRTELVELKSVKSGEPINLAWSDGDGDYLLEPAHFESVDVSAHPFVYADFWVRSYHPERTSDWILKRVWLGDRTMTLVAQITTQ